MNEYKDLNIMYSGTDKTASPRTIAMDTQHTNYASTVKGTVVVTLSDLPLQDGQIKFRLRSLVRPFSWLSPDLLLFNAAQSFILWRAFSMH